MDEREPRTECYCNDSFDVRCTCWVNDLTFDNCPQKLHTTTWRITNEYDLYKHIDKYDNYDAIKDYIKKTCRLSNKEWTQVKKNLRLHKKGKY